MKDLIKRDYYFMGFVIICCFLLLFLIIYRKKIFNKAQKSKEDSLSSGYGYYTDPVSSGCVSDNDLCTESSLEHVFQTCIPHPKTGNGCLDDEGNQTFDMIHTIKNCSKICKSQVLNVSYDPCLIVDKITGIVRNDFIDETCIPKKDTNIAGYYKKSYSCVGHDSNGHDGCQYLCGQEELLTPITQLNNLTNNSDLYNTNYPYIIGENLKKIQYCYDVDGYDQLTPLKSTYNCTLSTCSDYDPILIKTVTKNNFIFPSKCYDKETSLLILDQTVFRTPRLMRNGKEVLGGGCYNKQGVKKAMGEIIYLQEGDVLEVNVPCTSYPKPDCGSYMVSNSSSDKFLSCRQDLTLSHNSDNSSDCITLNDSDSSILKRFRKGLEKVTMECQKNGTTYDFCINPRMTMEWNTSNTYMKGDLIFVKNNITTTTFESSQNSNLNINPYYDFDYSHWDVSTGGVTAWNSATTYSVSNKATITTSDHRIKYKKYYRSLKNNNTANPITESPLVSWEIIENDRYYQQSDIDYTNNLGAWNSTTYYNPGEYVYSITNNQNSYYRAILSSKNQALTTKYWSKINVADTNSSTIDLDNINYFQGHIPDFLSYNKNLNNLPYAEVDNDGSHCIKPCYFLDNTASTSGYNYPELLTHSFILRLNVTRNSQIYNYVATLYHTPCKIEDKSAPTMPTNITKYSNCLSSKDDTLFRQIIYLANLGSGSNTEKALNLGLNDTLCSSFETNQHTKVNLDTDLTQIEASNGLLFFFVPYTTSVSGLVCKILVRFQNNFYGWLKYDLSRVINLDTTFNSSGASTPYVYFSQEKFNILDKSYDINEVIKSTSLETLISTEVDTFLINEISDGKYTIKRTDGNPLCFMTEHLTGYNLQDTNEGDYLSFVPAFSMDFLNSSYVSTLRSSSTSGCSLFN